MNPKEIKSIEVFAGELRQATTVLEILNDNQIEAYLQNENMGTIAPWYVAAGGSNPVKVIVSTSDYDASMKLINEFNQSE